MKRAVVHAYDDLDFTRDGTMTAAEVLDVALRFEGRFITLDLTKEHYETLREALAPYLVVGHKMPSLTRRGAGRQPTQYYTAAIKWAEANGIEYKYPAGSINHKKLRKLYDEHMATKGKEQTGKG